MRKALIDIDWLDAEIESENNRMKRSTHELHVRGFERSRNKLKLVRSKCEPVEEPKTLSVIGKANKKYSGLLYGEPKDLPTKCLLDWESAKYCHNDNACLMYKTK